MDTVKVSITSDSLKYEGETSITKAAQVIAFLNAQDRAPESPLHNEHAPEQYSLIEASPKVSPRQMLMNSNAKTNAERIATFAYYLKRSQGKQSVTMQDVKTLFARAGEPQPQNFSRDLKDAVRANFVFESENGDYELTEFGEEAVEKQFALDTLRKPERKRTKPKTTVEIRAEVTSLDIAAVEEGFPSFHSLNKGQQILWICVVADSKGLSELNYKEIVQLIDRLKGNVTTGTFSALNETNIKKGYLKPASTTTFKVTQPGINRIKELAQ